MRLKEFRQRRRPIPFANATVSPWLFRSFDDVALDLLDWAQRLPRISGVCGIPRSGAVVASILATLLNVPLIELGSLKSERPKQSKRLPDPSGPVLVLDDTLWSGNTLAEVRRQIAGDVIFGAVYANRENAHKLDVFGFALDSIYHCFAWNVLRDMHTPRVLTDMDGVLCDDWLGEVDHGECEQYLTFLRDAKPRLRPLHPVLGIVTGRCEQYRQPTEQWLARHGVAYHQLHMPFRSLAERRGECVGSRKADVYQHSPTAILFVESDRQQADVIQRRSGKPVLCSETWELFQ